MNAARSAVEPAVPMEAQATWSTRILPPADHPTTWHVSPAVDLAGYAFSWLLLAIPLYLVVGNDVLQLRDARPEGFLFIVAAVLFIDVHRNFTFPYVYLDRRLRSRFPIRFWLLPAIMAALLTQLPFWNGSRQVVALESALGIVAWILLVLQLLHEDQYGGERRRRALAATAIAAAASLSLGAIASPPVTAGWFWLLGAGGAAFFIARTAFEARGAPTRSLATWTVPAGIALLAGAAALADANLTVGLLMNGVIGVYVVWLIYHVMMQKYGILRLYSAKSAVETKVPAWVDRAIVWCWFPMVLVWSIGSSPELVLGYLDNMSYGTSRLVVPIVEFTSANFTAMMVLATAAIALPLGAFLSYEWRVHRLRNVPRLAFAGGLHLLFSSLFVLGGVGLYVAAAATHCVEYMTFVWAFQRRRYPTFDPQAPWLSRIVQHPIAFYLTATLIVAAILFFGRYARVYLGFDRESLTFFGAYLPTWVFWYSIMQAFVHFYFDGFLWKMQRTDLVKSL